MQLVSDRGWESADYSEVRTENIKSNSGELCVPFVKGEGDLLEGEMGSLIVLDQVTERIEYVWGISSEIGGADDTIVVFGSITTSIECPMTTTFLFINNGQTNTLKEGGACIGIIEMKHDMVELIMRANCDSLGVKSPLVNVVANIQWLNDVGDVFLDMGNG